MSNNKLAIAIALLVTLGGCATSRQHVEPYRDITCFQRAKVSLTEAIETAERSQGQMVIDAEYNCAAELDCVRGNPGQYRVTFFTEGRLSRIGICPATGAVQTVVQKGLFGRLMDLDFAFDWPESEMLESGPIVAGTPVRIRDAIATAEATGGKAMAAHVKTDSGKMSYVIEVVEGGQMRIVVVDPWNGMVVQEPIASYRDFIARLVNMG